ncbi:extracellular solute-binding protein [Paenibacillus mendelii]|uniref:Extracellular solute-binding protein n=1 Tax=Paenibacillus mendelii TaxID=206163 RepID=A0ABV6JHY9_9BACL|nr:extracellular solute-binding protein [Paenibacillus mendelii]MCQ6558400.1 extracellular solute-binding protein [Paenibacillus mendelii]
MKKMRGRTWVTVLLVMLMVVVSACGNSGEKKEEGGNKNANTQGSEGSGGTGNEEKTEGPIDPLGKYDPPIEISTVRIVNDTYKYAEGESIENNAWTRTLQEKLGITLKNKWVVSGDGPGGQGEQKMNVSIASGDLPDFIPVNSRQLKQLVEADLLMDLTDVYEKYASPFTKEIMNQDGPNALASATFDGKLMAIPNTGSAMDGAAMIWIRTDWLKKLNLPEPKTMDDVFKISEAFTTQDPDGNGKPDTIGISLNKDLYGGYASIDGFLNGYHAYPRQWIKDSSGKLVFGSVQPEMKQALAKLQELYKKGQIDREFGVKDGGKAAEFAAAGRVGLHFGTMSNPLWPLVDNKKNDKNAQWQSYPIVSVDDKPAQPRVGLAVGTYYAVLKETKNPEALLKVINLFVETGWGETTTPENYAEHFTKGGYERHKYIPFQTWPARKNLDIHLHVSEAIKSGDKSKLNPEETDNLSQIEAFLSGKEGTELGWGYERIFGIDGSFKTINQYVNDNSILMSEFYGAPTQTMVEKDATLQKMELEVFSKIIMGDSIDNFDKFVTDWKKLGGDKITEEVNAWYAAK